VMSYAVAVGGVLREISLSTQAFNILYIYFV